ncbi:thioredoxin 1 [Caloramator quimbayensis]|uniref:Thioredoxin 1 n=1 Tax=Caloramator quimbayensis TaxID=1147123 RepID=A0A1T4WWH6_9CLOT|nr:thioredoxin family protein [Caloramator quimbayensis]SKA81218.1 thioredoxin 1 [Caloramator quimbayensis]
MKRATKIIILILIVLGIGGVWGIKYYNNSSKNEDLQIENVNMPMLIDLGAGTCIPCKEMVPVLDEVKKMYDGKAKVVVVDVYEHPEIADKFGITLIPTQIFLDENGREFYRHEGYFPKEDIIKVFDEMGVK